MPRISFAHNAQDIVLSRLFPPDHKGFYIDAGANHPVLHNVTKLFYDQGWHGINIEPLAHLHKLLIEQRPRDTNLLAGICDSAGDMKFFHVHNPDDPDQTGELSHFDQDRVEEHRKLGWQVTEENVPVMTLREICEKYVTGPVDFLKIDVNGFERRAILGADLQKFRPRCLVIKDGQSGHSRARFQWSSLLENQGYKLALHDGVNVYFVDKDDSDALAKLEYPPSSVDDYSPFRFHRVVEDARSREIVAKGQLAAAQKQLTLTQIEQSKMHREIEEYQAMVADIGPNAMQTLRGWAKWVRTKPLLAKFAKSILGKE